MYPIFVLRKRRMLKVERSNLNILIFNLIRSDLCSFWGNGLTKYSLRLCDICWKLEQIKIKVRSLGLQDFDKEKN